MISILIVILKWLLGVIASVLFEEFCRRSYKKFKEMHMLLKNYKTKLDQVEDIVNLFERQSNIIQHNSEQLNKQDEFSKKILYTVEQMMENLNSLNNSKK